MFYKRFATAYRNKNVDLFLNNLIVLVCNFCFSNSPSNKANIFLGLIEYELNSLLGASHLVDYISIHIRFDLERYLLNVFKHLKGNFPLESQRSIIERTSKATGSSISTIKRIIKEERPRSPGKKRPNRKKFTTLDSFDLSVIRRIIHSFYSRNESPTLTKLLKKLKEEINFPYGRTNLFRLLKTLGFKYKKRGRESILNERSDLIMWRESFLRRIREVREKEPQSEIVYTYETWLNGGHRKRNGWT